MKQVNKENIAKRTGKAFIGWLDEGVKHAVVALALSLTSTASYLIVSSLSNRLWPSLGISLSLQIALNNWLGGLWILLFCYLLGSAFGIEIKVYRNKGLLRRVLEHE